MFQGRRCHRHHCPNRCGDGRHQHAASTTTTMAPPPMMVLRRIVVEDVDNPMTHATEAMVKNIMVVVTPMIVVDDDNGTTR